MYPKSCCCRVAPCCVPDPTCCCRVAQVPGCVPRDVFVGLPCVVPPLRTPPGAAGQHPLLGSSGARGPVLAQDPASVQLIPSGVPRRLRRRVPAGSSGCVLGCVTSPSPAELGVPHGVTGSKAAHSASLDSPQNHSGHSSILPPASSSQPQEPCVCVCLWVCVGLQHPWGPPNLSRCCPTASQPPNMAEAPGSVCGVCACGGLRGGYMHGGCVHGGYLHGGCMCGGVCMGCMCMGGCAHGV